MADTNYAATAGTGLTFDSRQDGGTELRPVVVIGADGTTAAVAAVLNAAPVSTDYGLVVRQIGNVTAIGAAADGAAVSGNPVLVAGQDGTNAQSLLTDTSGRQIAVGAAADGAAVAGNPVLIAGQDGTNAQSIRTDITGNVQVIGEVASDGVDSGNPIKIGGIADDSVPTAVGDLDRVNTWHDRHGRMHTRSGHQSAAANISNPIHVPVANTQATANRAAAGVGVRIVCTGLTATIAATATAPTAVNVTINLIDGVTGGTTYLWRMTCSLPATAGEVRGVTRSGLWIPGTANTQMTLEFSAAGGANTIESVSFETVTITE